MKSSSPLSAHWRSSKSRIVVPCAAIRSKKMRHAAKRTSRPPAGGGPRPRSVRSAGSTQLLTLLGVGGVLGDDRGDPFARRRLVVPLGQTGPLADHLSQGPERDPVAVGGGAAAVPVHGLDDAVDVLLQLPRQAALANAARTGDGSEASSPVAPRRAHEIPEEAELLVAPHERRLGHVRAAVTAALGDHPQRPPGGHGSGLALEELLAGFLEGDGRRSGPLCRFSHDDRAGRGDRLEPGGGVDEVAGDHALVRGADRHCRLAGQDAGARLDRRSQGPDRVHQLQPRPDGPLCVVLPGGRGAPDGHHGIPDELLDDTAVALDDVAGDVEVARQELAGLLRVPQRRA
jgi:hypothetical protein